MIKRICAIALITGCLSGCAADHKDTQFVADVTTDAKPWTDKSFHNDPDNFQFAIVSDRTGGHRPDIFSRAMERCNWLQPEFVICVGDLISGGTENLDVLNAEWDELQDRTESLEMPFFYLAGNHDIGNKVMADLWRQKFGPDYYSFVYHDVLFLCLNAQDGAGYSPGLSTDQITYMQQAITQHHDVRWTMVFVHQPLWLNDELPPDQDTGFSQITAALDDRPYTVFAGHTHKYAKYYRNDRNYYVLATTGGGSPLRGAVFGQLDHITWVTITDDGPRLANLALDGIYHDGLTDNTDFQLLEAFQSATVRPETPDALSGQLQLHLDGPKQESLKASLNWHTPDGCPWTIESPHQEISIPAGQKATMTWPIRFHGDPTKLSTRTLLPWANVNATVGGQVLLEDNAITIAKWVKEQIHLQPPTMICRSTETAPKVDAALSDSAWSENPDIPSFVPTEMHQTVSAPTAAWITYDQQALYFAVRCVEPDPTKMQLTAVKHDGPVWEDDSIEIFIDTNYDRKSFYQIIVNAKGVTYDGKSDGNSWNGAYRSAAAMTDKGWAIELAIPWQDIGLDGPPASNSPIGLNLVRNRPQANAEITQWAPTKGSNWRPQLYGTLTF